MLTFISTVKDRIGKREKFEQHKSLPVKKLITKDNHRGMQKYLKDLSKQNSRSRIEVIPELGTIMYFPLTQPRTPCSMLRHQAEYWGLSQVLHLEHRPDERTVYACLEQLD